jgi:hypothetical protein
MQRGKRRRNSSGCGQRRFGRRVRRCWLGRQRRRPSRLERCRRRQGGPTRCINGRSGCPAVLLPPFPAARLLHVLRRDASQRRLLRHSLRRHARARRSLAAGRQCRWLPHLDRAATNESVLWLRPRGWGHLVSRLIRILKGTAPRRSRSRSRKGWLSRWLNRRRAPHRPCPRLALPTARLARSSNDAGDRRSAPRRICCGRRARSGPRC